MATILAADLGGTHASFALFVNHQKIWQESFATKQIIDLAGVVKDVLAQHGTVSLDGVCFGIAAPPVFEGTVVRMANTSLSFETTSLRNVTGCDVMIINDFEALAYAVGCGKLDEFSTQKTPHDIMLERRCLLIGPGTGLGKCYVEHTTKKSVRVLSSEGGHSSFIVEDDLDQHILHFAQARLGPMIEQENIVSGHGLLLLYEFFAQHHNAQLQSGLSGMNDSQKLDILTRGTDDAFTYAKQYFMRQLARVCVNDVMHLNAWGGIVLCGGVLVKHQDWLTQQFFDELARHPKYGSELASLPVRLLTDYSASLQGCSHALMCDKEC